MSNTVLITGATGLVGKALVKKCLQNGFNVHYLTTRKSKIKLQENYKGFYWNPQLDSIDISCFEGVDIVINLVIRTLTLLLPSATVLRLIPIVIVVVLT